MFFCRIFCLFLLAFVSCSSLTFAQETGIEKSSSESGFSDNVDINDIRFRFCSEIQLFSGKPSLEFKVSKDSDIPLCFYYENTHSEDIVVRTKLTTVNSSGSCTSTVHPMGWEVREDVLNTLDYVQTGGYVDTYLSGHTSGNLVFLPKIDVLGQNFEFCVGVSEADLSDVRYGGYRINIIKTKLLSLEFQGADKASASDVGIAKILPTGPLSTYEVPMKNLIKSTPFHLGHKDGKYFLSFTLFNDSEVFSRFTLSGSLSTIFNEHSFHKVYDLPPGTQNPVIIEIDSTGSSLGYGQIKLNYSFLGLYKNAEETIRAEQLSTSFFHITKYVYFFALFLVILYNIYIWRVDRS